MPIFANLGAIDTPLGLIVICSVVVLLFGGNKLASFGKSLGYGLKEFKDAVREEPAAKPIESKVLDALQPSDDAVKKSADVNS